VLREALHTLMEGVPAHLDLHKIGLAMASLEGVVSVHDLHIWSLSASSCALSAHIVIRDLSAWPGILKQSHELLLKEFGIDHVTLQPESETTLVPVEDLNLKSYRSLHKP
jgi:cobalt-zinc-cadmium efflux system protein